MKKKGLVYCIVAVMFLCSADAFAEEEKAEGVAVEVSSQWLNKYVSTGGAVFSADPVVQSGVLVSYRGFYGLLWHSTGIDSDIGGNPGAELDFYLGWTGKLSWLNISILDEVEADVSVSYQDYSKLFSRMKDDFIALNLEVRRPWEVLESHTLAPFFKAEYYFPLSGESSQQGIYASLGLKHSWKLLKSLTFEQSVRGTYDSGTYGLESGFVAGYAANLQLKVTDSFRVDLGQFQYIVPISHFHDRKNEVIWGGGVRILF